MNILNSSATCPKTTSEKRKTKTLREDPQFTDQWHTRVSEAAASRLGMRLKVQETPETSRPSRGRS